MAFAYPLEGYKVANVFLLLPLLPPVLLLLS